MIFHLSYDFKKDGLKSVNHYTPKDKCSGKYRDLDYAVKTFLDLYQEPVNKWEYEDIVEVSQSDMAKEPNRINREQLKKEGRKRFNGHKETKPVIIAGKSDLKSAFCILGLSKTSWQWLVMKA